MAGPVGPAVAEETSLSFSPAHAPAGGSAAVELLSDCKLNYLNLTYARYDGATKTATTLTDGRFDERLQRYRYTGRLAVPGDAAPGSAVAFAQPYCGPPEEYPASRDVAFAVDRSVLRLAVSPSRVPAVAGTSLRVSGGDCAGPVTSVPLLVRWPGGAVSTVGATVRERKVSAVLRLPSGVRVGSGSVSLARADACPGSRAAGAATFTTVFTSVRPSVTPPPVVSAAPTPEPALTGLATPSVAPVSSAPVAAPVRRTSRGRSVLVVGLAVVAVAAAAGGALLRWRRP